MKNALSWIFAWLLASICTFVFASIAHSQFVLLELVKIDIAIPAGEWLSMTLSDIIGLSVGYGGAICVAMLLCFGVLSLINKRFNLPVWSYIIFAALAMAVMLLAMQPILNVTLIAGARSTMGFIAQCCAGLIGGYVFARLRA
ncbi:hypothetical protein QTP81_14295 [Alteromonas sp. ASW11-36]|uniref:Uncharacterized protein n=1 Tax=Alteromonas arenosi TaxID=3055817 RepID=A0ABT7T0J0_9ALTE|nr:hypothetical protein [Alteromonas sp. ASW11-36]MDM7861769.1 hypothetical protein [Alteromonas sp. ASW11-36]